MHRFFAGALALLFIAFAPAVFADPFTIANVAISATASDAAKAKEIAIAKGQRKAFQRLIRRLTLRRDAEYLPKTEEGDVESLVAGFSLSNERPGPKQYGADLTVRFTGQSVRQYLENYGVPMAEMEAGAVLVIPLLKQGESVLAGQGNAWYEAWEGQDLENTLAPVLLPVGDASDLSVTPEMLIQGRPGDLEQLQQRYAVAGVLIAVAEATGDGGVRTSLRGTSPMGQIEFEKTVTDKTGSKAAMTAAVRNFTGLLEERWKNSSIEEGSGLARGESVSISVPFRGLQEWINIRKVLSAMPGVTKLDVRAMTASGAHVMINYEGGIDKLVQDLAQRRLELTDLGQFWELRPARMRF